MAGSSEERRSYYEVLGIVRTAKAGEVEAAFRKLARRAICCCAFRCGRAGETGAQEGVGNPCAAPIVL